MYFVWIESRLGGLNLPDNSVILDAGRHPRGVKLVHWKGLDREVVVIGCGGCVCKVEPFGVDIINSCYLGPRVLH